jgi:hypothetical protein
MAQAFEDAAQSLDLISSIRTIILEARKFSRQLIRQQRVNATAPLNKSAVMSLWRKWG